MQEAVPVLSAVALQKTYRKYAIKAEVLRGLDLEVQQGEFLSIVGASGSGKSTLLHLLGVLDRPDKGEILFDGKRIDNLPSQRRDQLRNQTFGFIFQFYHLLPELTALENVLMPQMIARSVFGWMVHRREIKNRAVELLDRVGLGRRLHHRPRELSGGEMQRAAVARALINRPRVLLADEPTGNLDEETARQVLPVLLSLARKRGATLVIVTHDTGLALSADRMLELRDGRLQEVRS
jgi:lipoprotein-releasing system ATP-binding protein